MPSVALIAGVSRHLGGQVAAQLAADPAVERVIGIDTVPPRTSQLPLLGRTEFVRADIRNPLIARVITQARVTAVVHAALVSSPRQVGGRVPMQETNVIGTMQLLAACQNSEHVERIVLASTTAVYGSGPADPAVFTEDTPPGDGSPAGFAKDATEVESYVRGFARRRPDVTTTILRMARILGPGADSALSRYLAAPVVPTAAGFDPRVQLLHELDAVEAVRLATISPRPGTFNVAGPGAVPLSQLLRRAGRIQLPVPAASLAAVGSALANSGVLDVLAEEPNLMKYGRVVDTTRLRHDFGYAPRFTTADALAACLDQPGALPRLGALALGVGSQLVQARRERRLLPTGSAGHAEG
jgi:UDP-glucose 4-epimerase